MKRLKNKMKNDWYWLWIIIMLMIEIALILNFQETIQWYIASLLGYFIMVYCYLKIRFGKGVKE